jgi:hypothetical protein
MKRYYIISFIIVITFFLSSCAGHTSRIQYEDKYIPDQDSQQYSFDFGASGGIAETQEGYYFLSSPGNRFLYFYDKKNNTSVQVCAKPNCLHDNEPDSMKIASCNAFLGVSVSNLIYYNKSLYYITEDTGPDEMSYELWRMSLQGTEKRRIHEFKEIPLELRIHRGYVYYLTNDGGTIPGKEDTTKSKYTLSRFSLEKSGDEVEVIHEGEGIYGKTAGLLCYGNNVFYSVFNYLDATLQSFTENSYRYDIVDEKEQVIIEEEGSGAWTIFDGKLVYTKNTGIFACNFDGSDIHKVADEYGQLSSNDDYLFIDNWWDLDVLDGIKDRTVTVLDKSYKVVKTISLKGVRPQAYGCSNEYYFVQDVGEPSAIIGKMQGKVYEISATIHELPKLQKLYRIRNLVKYGDTIVAQIVTDVPPRGNVREIHPSLEDAYLYFSGE